MCSLIWVFVFFSFLFFSISFLNDFNFKKDSWSLKKKKIGDLLYRIYLSFIFIILGFEYFHISVKLLNILIDFLDIVKFVAVTGHDKLCARLASGTIGRAEFGIVCIKRAPEFLICCGLSYCACSLIVLFSI